MQPLQSMAVYQQAVESVSTAQQNHLDFFGLSMQNKFSLHLGYHAATSLKFVTLTLFSLGVCLSGVSGFAQGLPERPPTEDLLPETTVVYAKITSFSTLFEKIQSSMQGKMLEDDAFAPMTQQLYESAQDSYGQVEEQVGLSLDELQSLPSGELSIAVIAPRRKDMAMLVLMELDEENEAIDKAFDRARDLLSEEAPLEEEPNDIDIKIEKTIIKGNVVYFCRHQGLLVGSTSLTELQNVFLRWSGVQDEKVRPLSKNRKFITINNRCTASEDMQPDARFYADPIGIFKASARGSVGMQVAVAMLPTLGLDGLLAVGGNSYYLFEGYENILHAHVLLASPREGVFDALALKPGSYQPEDFVPVNIGSYITTSWDAQQMFGKIGEMVDQFTDGEFEKQLLDFNNKVQIDIKADIVDAITGRVSIIRPILSGTEFNAIGNVFAAELKDAEAFTEFIETRLAAEEGHPWMLQEHEGVAYWSMGDKLENDMRSNRKRWRERQNKRRKKRGADPLPERDNGFSDMYRFPRPTFAVVGDYLIFGDNEEFIQTAIETYNGDGERLVDDAEFERTAEMMTRLLKTDLPAAMLYADSAREIGMLLRTVDSEGVRDKLAEMAEEQPEYFSGMKAAFDDNALPTYEDVAKFIPASGGFITTDDSGYHILLFQETRETDE